MSLRPRPPEGVADERRSDKAREPMAEGARQPASRPAHHIPSAAAAFLRSGSRRPRPPAPRPARHLARPRTPIIVLARRVM